ncbi:Protein DEK like protein [Argiope bruennichi]|uniref:Protein DEK like protein n=1 Tax=Argiope bruennichi TaxID=94029 RepID=A0A8T0E2D8_ARGBR|nr:Protein DEK like protein [Argiope bruennichi]
MAHEERPILSMTEIKQELPQEQESINYNADMVVKEEVQEQTSDSASSITIEEETNKSPVLSAERTNALSKEQKDITVKPLNAEVKASGRRGRRRKIYDNNDDPETIKEKRKKRAVELKLRNLKWTLNQESDVSGKRQKKVPQRFELVPVDKRKSCMDDCQGRGEALGNIPWIHQQLQTASIYTLRLLHRTIYRKQGMFSEKHIRRSVVKFTGFPFDGTHPEIRKRREQLERANVGALGNLCDLLALRRASKDVMIDRIIGFLLFPTHESVENYLQDAMAEKLQQSKIICAKAAVCSPNLPASQRPDPFHFLLAQENQEAIQDICNISQEDAVDSGNYGGDINNIPWKKPAFFSEGNGVKLKYIRAIASNIQASSDNFIELLHRLLYLNVDERLNMKRNILEFSGLKCHPSSNNHVYRMRILSVLPMEQVKLICKVLCLPTWHRSRQLLTEGIIDFLAAPRISVMKKRVPPHFTDEITFTFDSAKTPKVPDLLNTSLPELQSDELEEIEIFPDIHIQDEGSPSLENDFSVENEYLGVKLKNFSNIHYQVISTPAAKLNDVHMILYLTTSAQNNIRRNILEFSGYPFDESSTEYQCRRNLMEQMSLDDLKTVATVLCVSQYIVDESKDSLIDAILKFLLKPSALLNSSTIMPTISSAPISRRSPVVKKKATSTSKTPQLNDILPEIVISEVKTLANDKDKPAHSVNSSKNVVSSCTATSTVESNVISTPEFKKITASLSNDIQILPLPKSTDMKEEKNETDEPLSKVKSSVSITPRTMPLVDSVMKFEKPFYQK